MSTNNAFIHPPSGDKTPLSKARPGLIFALASSFLGVISLFLPLFSVDGLGDTEETFNITILKALTTSGARTPGLFVSVGAIFIVLIFSIIPFVNGGKFSSISAAGRAIVTAGSIFVAGRILDFIKLSRDGGSFDVIGIGFILFTVAGVLMLIAGLLIRNTANRIESETNSANGAAAAYGQAQQAQQAPQAPAQPGQQAGFPPNAQQPYQNGQYPYQNGQQPYQNGQQPYQNGQQPWPHQ